MMMPLEKKMLRTHHAMLLLSLSLLLTVDAGGVHRGLPPPAVATDYGYYGGGGSAIVVSNGKVKPITHLSSTQLHPQTAGQLSDQPILPTWAQTSGQATSQVMRQPPVGAGSIVQQEKMTMQVQVPQGHLTSGQTGQSQPYSQLLNHPGLRVQYQYPPLTQTTSGARGQPTGTRQPLSMTQVDTGQTTHSVPSKYGAIPAKSSLGGGQLWAAKPQTYQQQRKLTVSGSGQQPPSILHQTSMTEQTGASSMGGGGHGSVSAPSNYQNGQQLLTSSVQQVGELQATQPFVYKSSLQPGSEPYQQPTGTIGQGFQGVGHSHSQTQPEKQKFYERTESQQVGTSSLGGGYYFPTIKPGIHQQQPFGTRTYGTARQIGSAQSVGHTHALKPKPFQVASQLGTSSLGTGTYSSSVKSGTYQHPVGTGGMGFHTSGQVGLSQNRPTGQIQMSHQGTQQIGMGSETARGGLYPGPKPPPYQHQPEIQQVGSQLHVTHPASTVQKPYQVAVQSGTAQLGTTSVSREKYLSSTTPGVYQHPVSMGGLGIQEPTHKLGTGHPVGQIQTTQQGSYSGSFGNGQVTRHVRGQGQVWAPKPPVYYGDAVRASTVHTQAIGQVGTIPAVGQTWSPTYPVSAGVQFGQTTSGQVGSGLGVGQWPIKYQTGTGQVQQSSIQGTGHVVPGQLVWVPKSQVTGTVQGLGTGIQGTQFTNVPVHNGPSVLGQRPVKFCCRRRTNGAGTYGNGGTTGSQAAVRDPAIPVGRQSAGHATAGQQVNYSKGTTYPVSSQVGGIAPGGGNGNYPIHGQSGVNWPYTPTGQQQPPQVYYKPKK